MARRYDTNISSQRVTFSPLENEYFHAKVDLCSLKLKPGTFQNKKMVQKVTILTLEALNK